jgi:hypothetical protein
MKRLISNFAALGAVLLLAGPPPSVVVSFDKPTCG